MMPRERIAKEKAKDAAARALLAVAKQVSDLETYYNRDETWPEFDAVASDARAAIAAAEAAGIITEV